MARRKTETHLWTFDPEDETSVPNARIALALMVCVRRLPGAFPEHDFDDLGSVLAPVLASHERLTQTTVLAHILVAQRAYAATHLRRREVGLLGKPIHSTTVLPRSFY